MIFCSSGDIFSSFLQCHFSFRSDVVALLQDFLESAAIFARHLDFVAGACDGVFFVVSLVILIMCLYHEGAMYFRLAFFRAAALAQSKGNIRFRHEHFR